MTSFESLYFQLLNILNGASKHQHVAVTLCTDLLLAYAIKTHSWSARQ